MESGQSGTAGIAPILGRVLVDFDNVLCVNGRHPTPEEFGASMTTVIEQLFEEAPEIERVEVRLYGGWLTTGVATASASQALQTVALASVFPITVPNDRRRVHGQIDLALSLLCSPDTDLRDMYRETPGVGRILLAAGRSPLRCPAADPDNECPAVLARRFTKKRNQSCPAAGCDVRNNEAFVTRQQKMVDTLLACDLLESASDDTVRCTLVMTADTDFIPPLVAAAKTANILLWAPVFTWSEDLCELLTAAGIGIPDD